MSCPWFEFRGPSQPSIQSRRSIDCQSNSRVSVVPTPESIFRRLWAASSAWVSPNNKAGANHQTIVHWTSAAIQFVDIAAILTINFVINPNLSIKLLPCFQERLSNGLLLTLGLTNRFAKARGRHDHCQTRTTDSDMSIHGYSPCGRASTHFHQTFPLSSGMRRGFLFQRTGLGFMKNVDFASGLERLYCLCEIGFWGRAQPCSVTAPRFSHSFIVLAPAFEAVSTASLTASTPTTMSPWAPVPRSP